MPSFLYAWPRTNRTFFQTKGVVYGERLTYGFELRQFVLTTNFQTAKSRGNFFTPPWLEREAPIRKTVRKKKIINSLNRKLKCNKDNKILFLFKPINLQSQPRWNFAGHVFGDYERAQGSWKKRKEYLAHPRIKSCLLLAMTYLRSWFLLSLCQLSPNITISITIFLMVPGRAQITCQFLQKGTLNGELIGELRHGLPYQMPHHWPLDPKRNRWHQGWWLGMVHNYCSGVDRHFELLASDSKIDLHPTYYLDYAKVQDVQFLKAPIVAQIFGPWYFPMVRIWDKPLSVSLKLDRNDWKPRITNAKIATT